MKETLFHYLICPACSGDIKQLTITATDNSEIMEGELGCVGCNRHFPIIRGIPRFAQTDQIELDKVATAERFGWSWQHFNHNHQLYADQFLGWLAPVRPECFAGKAVLEGGCGKGRHTQLAASWGARDVISFDLSDAVEPAFAATRGLKNAHIIQADIFHLPLRQAFDYAFSVGVLHHLPDPKAGFIALASKVKPGGHISAWVYGAENNSWIKHFVDPLRKNVTSRISPQILLQLSKLPTALLYVLTKTVYGPLNKSTSGQRVARHLFYNDYMKAISSFDWRDHHLIVFDHLIAPTAFYIDRAEFEEWWREIHAIDVVIGWHNQNSWRGFGKIPTKAFPAGE